MISIPVHKDISHYEPKVVAGLTARTLVFTTLACGVGVLIGMLVAFGLGQDPSDFPWVLLIMGASAGFWAMGYVRPLGLPFEQWASLAMRACLTNQRLEYKSTGDLGRAPQPGCGTSKETYVRKQGKAEEALERSYARLRGRRGVELWEPGE